MPAAFARPANIAIPTRRGCRTSPSPQICPNIWVTRWLAASHAKLLKGWRIAFFSIESANLDGDESAWRRHKTAIKRQSPSQIARMLDEQGVLSSLGVQSILDFGCGYGADVEFYRSIGYEADGFDIEPRFGWTQRSERLHDLVTLVFVVNVLPTSEDRVSVVRDAAQHVRPGGYLLIAARSESAISAEARKGNWAPFNDGWISAPQKGTFQKGIALAELAWCAGAIGFRIVECSLRLSSDVSWLLCWRPA